MVPKKPATKNKKRKKILLACPNKNTIMHLKCFFLNSIRDSKRKSILYYTSVLIYMHVYSAIVTNKVSNRRREQESRENEILYNKEKTTNQ